MPESIDFLCEKEYPNIEFTMGIKSQLDAGLALPVIAAIYEVSYDMLLNWLARGKTEFLRVRMSADGSVDEGERPYFEFYTLLHKSVARAESDLYNKASKKDPRWMLMHRYPDDWRRKRIVGSQTASAKQLESCGCWLSPW